jgi:hypothetical protein
VVEVVLYFTQQELLAPWQKGSQLSGTHTQYKGSQLPQVQRWSPLRYSKLRTEEVMSESKCRGFTFQVSYFTYITACPEGVTDQFLQAKKKAHFPHT